MVKGKLDFFWSMIYKSTGEWVTWFVFQLLKWACHINNTQILKYLHFSCLLLSTQIKITQCERNRQSQAGNRDQLLKVMKNSKVEKLQFINSKLCSQSEDIQSKHWECTHAHTYHTEDLWTNSKTWWTVMSTNKCNIWIIYERITSENKPYIMVW